MNNLQILSKRIKELRLSKKMTQTEFADAMGFTKTTLSAYENNSKKPSLDLLLEISKRCDVSLDWLCGLDVTNRNVFTTKDYSDVIKNLYYLLQNKIVNFDITDKDEYVSITTNDEIISSFILKYKHMKKLLQSNLIDQNLFDLWIQDVLNQYKIKD